MYITFAVKFCCYYMCSFDKHLYIYRVCSYVLLSPVFCPFVHYDDAVYAFLCCFVCVALTFPTFCFTCNCIVIVCTVSNSGFVCILFTFSFYRLVRQFLMGFQAMAFLSSQTSFYTTFIEHCGRCDSHRTTTCLKTVVGGKQGHATYKVLLLHEACFCVS